MWFSQKFSQFQRNVFFIFVCVFFLSLSLRTAFRKQPSTRPNVIQHDEQDLDIDFRGKMIISSGKLTYRIPSPTRPSRSLNKNSFQVSIECINFFTRTNDANWKTEKTIYQFILLFRIICHHRILTKRLTTNKKVSTLHSIIHNPNGQSRLYERNDHQKKSIASIQPIKPNK